MIAWFVAIGAFGVAGVAEHPEILKALSPAYALDFLVGHFDIAFFALAAVVLAVTGAEALYADMGHFGRRAITRGWLFLVFPACVLSYLGQGALVLVDPANVSSPFFLLVPEWGRLPMVLLATAATVIASQAVITGAFSVASQAAQLGYLPRLRAAHTSDTERGQIYVPWINWLLMVSVLTLVFAFRTSAALAFAFGMATSMVCWCLHAGFVLAPGGELPSRSGHDALVLLSVTVTALGLASVLRTARADSDAALRSIPLQRQDDRSARQRA